MIEALLGQSHLDGYESTAVSGEGFRKDVKEDGENKKLENERQVCFRNWCF